MERPPSPATSTGSPSVTASSAPASPTPSDGPATAEAIERKKKTRKKRKVAPPSGGGDDAEAAAAVEATARKPKIRKGSKKRKETKSKEDDGATRKKARKQARRAVPTGGASGGAGQLETFSAAQLAVNEQMRRALEEDQYSALGSIVDTDSDEDDNQYHVRGGGTMRMDRATVMAAMRKRLWMDRMGGSANFVTQDDDEEEEGADDTSSRRGGKKKKRKKRRRSKEEAELRGPKDISEAEADRSEAASASEAASPDEHNDVDFERDEGSIFGHTTGARNATWVECDKCKKWRRLRGVVDEKKLPSKWFCSMNKNDPERSRCSAPEEAYETQVTPESAADARTRKHLRIWVRRLQSNEAYESRQPTMTRGKKRSAVTNSKEPYEWVRCCDPSCGKWRAVLRFMDAKTHVIDRTENGEWYCVMNTWDEKTASCAAPQENLPAIGCPPWCMQDED